LSANAASTTVANSAAYVTGENQLYVFGATGSSLRADDLVIKFSTSVTSLNEKDFLLGSQSTGNFITVASGATVATTGATSGATVTATKTNTPDGSTNTTDNNDTVTGTMAAVAAATTVNAGAGSDTLALSILATASNNDGQATTAELANFTGFETVTLADRANSTTIGSVYYDVRIPFQMVADNTTLTITLSDDGVAADGSLSSAGSANIVTAANITTGNTSSSANRKVSITGGTGHDSLLGGDFNDTINGGDGNDAIGGNAGTNVLSGGNGDDAITSGSLTDSIDGGAGNDTVTLITATYTSVLGGGAGAVDTLAVIDATDIKGATVSGFEVLDFAGGTTMAAVMTVAEYAGFTSGVTSTGAAAAATSTITLVADTAAKATGTVTVDADVIKYTVGTSSSTVGVAFAGISADTTAFSITGGDGNDTINFGTHGAANQSIAGGAGDDAITLKGDTFDSSDAIDGGSGTDTLVITDAAISTGNLGSGITGLEVITLQNVATNATIVFNNTANVGTSITINATSMTTGALSFTALSSETGTHSVTGGSGADSITGGAGNDTLVGGAGSDTLIGGTGVDTISDVSGNNSITGGIGNDAITLGSGTDTIQWLAGDARDGTTVYTDTITGFTGGTTSGDVLRLGVGDLDGHTTGTMTFSDSTGTDIGSAGAAGVIKTVLTNEIVTLTTTANVLRFTSVTSDSFSSAFGSGAITLNVGTTGAFAVGAIGTNTTEGILAIYYDATNSRAVVGFISNAVGQSGGDLDVINASDTFSTIAFMGMTSTEYGTLVNGNIIFGG